MPCPGAISSPRVLVAHCSLAHKPPPVTTDLFDPRLRALRRDRAARNGAELFLLDRAFDDCLDRLTLVRRGFERVMLIGCPNSAWADRLRGSFETVEIFDPGTLFAQRVGGRQSNEAELPVEPAAFDLILAIGTLDTVNALPDVLLRLRLALQPGGLLLGAISGGETLPQLRAAMRAADETMGAAMPHVHPRIEPAGLASLLSAAGFDMPVVDVDRVQVRYEAFARLVSDLRGMAAANVLVSRPKKPLRRSAAAAAADAFQRAGDGSKTTETFEILHFAAWAAEPAAGNQAQG